MKICWLGHSAFLIENNSGIKIVTDPFDEYVGYKMSKVFADVLITSHEHKDHNNSNAVDGQRIIISKSGEYEFGDVRIFAFNVFHDDRDGALRGTTLVTKIVTDGITLCHMGDIGENFNRAIVDKIGFVDVLFVPVGGVYTIDCATAYDYAKEINAKCVIPMHYKTDDCVFPIDTAEKFFDFYNSKNIIVINGNNLLTETVLTNESNVNVVKFKCHA